MAPKILESSDYSEHMNKLNAFQLVLIDRSDTGAGNFDIAYLVMLKQIFPRILNSIRINLKSVALFLFAGEMIASDDGLAYRIALLRRHMGMDTIIPYVLWVGLLLFLVDLTMRFLNRRLHPWFREI